MLHNVACIYAELSQLESDREKEYQDLALILLRRAVELWKRQRGRPGVRNELELIKKESAFPESLQSRREFKELFRE